MKKRIPFIDTLRPFSTGLILLAIVTFMLCFRLFSLLPAASPAEAHTLQSANQLTISGIFKDSTFFAYKVGLFVLKETGLLRLTTVRGLSVICGLFGAAAFYLLLRKWHTRRMATLGSILFVSSSWFLQASRFGVPEAMYLFLPVLIYLGVKLDDGTQRLSVAVISVLALTQLLYLPGMVWLLAIGIIWQRKRITERLREIHYAALVFLWVLTAALMIPLIVSLLTNGSFWQDWLAYPFNDQTVVEFLRNLAVVPWHIFFKNIIAPEFHIGRLPLLDIASSVFVALGIYWYFFQRKLDRTKLIVGGLLFSSLLIASLGTSAQLVMLPFIYILATGGLTLLLQQWFTVFPRNPLARSIGLVLVIGIVALTSFYHLRRYYVAWPNTPATKLIYSIQSDTI